MIISIDAEKAFNKIQHPFMTKAVMKLGIQGMYLNIRKAIYDKPIANIILSGKKLKPFPLKSGIILTQHSLRIPSQSNKTGRYKRITNWKGSSQTILFADDMILYLKDLKNSTKTLQETINSFSKIAGYKISSQNE
jgi:hypothetical protein